MKVLDYTVGALAAAADIAQHPRHRAAVSYPTAGVDSIPRAPRVPIQTPSATTAPSNLPTGIPPYGIQIIKPRGLVARNQSIDTSKPMLGLYPEDKVTTETTTFENGIDDKKWIVDTRIYGGSQDNPFLRQMEPQNVKVEDGNLILTVPGGQKYEPDTYKGLSSAQIMSTKMFSVGSFEMTVKMGTEEGTCQCGFFYGSDHNEVDLEYLTRTNVSWGVVQSMARGMPIQQVDLNITKNQADDFHTYKVVRTESSAYYFMDGQLVNTFDKNIPTEPVQVMIAHWTDANPGWTGGPPAKDAKMTVKKLVVEYVGATQTFSTSTAGPSPTESGHKKGAASRGYASSAGSLLAIAALSFYLAL